MGMLFNTKATTRMLQVVNDAFASDSKVQWQTLDPYGVAPADYFLPDNAGKWPLYKIAKQMKIFGGAGEDSPEDKRFQKWLRGLDAAGASPAIRAQIRQGLTDKGIAEIFFVVVPAKTIAVAAKPPVVNGTLVVTVSTVEVDHVAAFVTAYRARLTARRAARTKKKG
jgi:hypothetical protein